MSKSTVVLQRSDSVVEGSSDFVEEKLKLVEESRNFVVVLVVADIGSVAFRSYDLEPVEAA